MIEISATLLYEPGVLQRTLDAVQIRKRCSLLRTYQVLRGSLIYLFICWWKGDNKKCLEHHCLPCSTSIRMRRPRVVKVTK